MYVLEHNAFSAMVVLKEVFSEAMYAFSVSNGHAYIIYSYV